MSSRLHLCMTSGYTASIGNIQIYVSMLILITAYLIYNFVVQKFTWNDIANNDRNNNETNHTVKDNLANVKVITV